MPVVLPLAYNERTAWIEVYSAGTLKVSKRICAAVSRLLRGFRGGSVRRMGCCDASVPVRSEDGSPKRK